MSLGCLSVCSLACFFFFLFLFSREGARWTRHSGHRLQQKLSTTFINERVVRGDLKSFLGGGARAPCVLYINISSQFSPGSMCVCVCVYIYNCGETSAVHTGITCSNTFIPSLSPFPFFALFSSTLCGEPFTTPHGLTDQIAALPVLPLPPLLGKTGIAHVLLSLSFSFHIYSCNCNFFSSTLSKKKIHRAPT
jgi:hypothetical protein